MKLHIQNKKPLIALTLVFFLMASMLLAISPVRADPTSGTFSVVQQGTGGTTNVNSITLPSSPNPIGTTIKFDVYISNAANIWGWTIGTVSWNPAVLKVTKVQEGSWLANNAPNGDPTSFVGSSSSLWDNVGGKINGGISEAIGGADLSIDPAGVVATLTFQVIGYGSSSVTIDGGNLRTSSSDHTGISAPCNSASVIVQQPVTAIGLFAHSSTSTNIAYPSLSNPIGSTFQADINITGATGVWGWNVGVTWNPNVIQLQSVTEGSYLSQSGATLFAPGYVDNYNGKVQAGISDAFTSYMSASASQGCLAVLTFKIVSYSPGCNINLTAGLPSTLLNQNVPHGAITPVVLNNGTYSWTPAPAQAPQAVITTSGSPFGAGSNQTLTLMPITFDGSHSVAGTDMVPPYENCPITSYSWTITLADGTQVTANTPTVALSAAQVGTNPGSIVASLTVTAPDPDMIPAPTYNPVNTTTFTVQVLPPLPQGWNNWSNGNLDIWTQNGGQGWNQSANDFAPQQLVNLTALVTYNGAPVVGKQVTFNVYLNGAYIDYRTAITNGTGIATTSYRFPWQDSNPTAYFGVVNITSVVDLSQVTLNDACSFYYGYQLCVQNVKISNGIYDNSTGQNIGPVFFRNYAGLNMVNINLDVTSHNWNTSTFWIAATIYDNNSVPVAQVCVQDSALGTQATVESSTAGNTNTHSISLSIPTYAFVGPATIYVNIYNANPAQSGLPYSPEQSAQLYIYSGQ